MNENYEISSIGEKIIIISPEGPLQLYKWKFLKAVFLY